MHDLIRVATFSNRLDAELAQAVLESNGIRASVEIDDAGTMLPTLGGGGVYVRAEDEAAAREALERQPEETPQELPED